MKVIVYPYDLPIMRRHAARRLLMGDALTSLFYSRMLRKVRYGQKNRK